MNSNLTSIKKSIKFRNILYATGSFVTGYLLKELFSKGWEYSKGTKPPSDPSQSHATFKDALMWTIGLSLLSGLGKMAFKSLFEKPDE